MDQEQPRSGRDAEGAYTLSCPRCCSSNIEIAPSDYLADGMNLCADCGFEEEAAEFREYLSAI